MFCTNCGKEIEEGNTFCTHCGKPIEESDQAQYPNQAGVSEGPVSAPAQPSVSQNTEEAQSGVQAFFDKLPLGAWIGIAAAVVALIVGIVVLALGATSAPSTTATTSKSTASQTSSVEQSEALTVKASYADYSWQELADIAEKISSCSSDAAALNILKEYNLADAAGKLTTSSKEMKLTDGTSIGFQIAGYYHDTETAGSKVTGLTFITAKCLGTHAMNTGATNSGGWSASGMRTWLNSTVFNTLPSEVQSNVRSVSKLSNNAGKTQYASSVGTTADKLWLFSWPELLGPVSWNTGSSTAYIDTVVNAEGSQYQLFSQNGIAGKQDNDPAGLLRKDLVGGGAPVSWWTRSSTPNRADGFGDVDNGGVDNGGIASNSQGVVFGFCF